MGCCCCPSRETFGRTSLWLVEKSTGDIVWRRSGGDESGQHAYGVFKGGSRYIAHKYRSGDRAEEYDAGNLPWMEREADFGGVQFSSYDEGVAAGSGSWSVSGTTYQPLYWLSSRDLSGFDNDHPVAYATATPSSGPATKTMVSAGELNGAGHMMHESPITIDGSDNVYYWRNVGSPTFKWYLTKKVFPTLTTSDVKDWPLTDFFGGSGSSIGAHYGKPFHRGSIVYGLFRDTTVPGGAKVRLRSWNAHTGASIADVVTAAETYIHRGWLSADTVYFFDVNRTTLWCVNTSDGSTRGTWSPAAAGDRFSDVFGPQFIYTRSNGDLMLTSFSVFPHTSQLNLIRIGHDGNELWRRTVTDSNKFGCYTFPIGEETLGETFGLLRADGSTRWEWRVPSVKVYAARDLGNWILCAGNLPA
jgi:hypothetical protein